LSILRLVPFPGRIVGGEVFFDGVDILKLDAETVRKIRGKRISIVFQDALTSLNPVLTVGEQLAEPLMTHLGLTRREAYERAAEILQRVGIPDAGKRLANYPHQFSGGMRQRVLIGMAISCNPELLIADEPTTALDVTTQKQIMELFRELIRKMNMTLLLITHDVGVAADLCDYIYVMYAGQIVEKGPAEQVITDPKHPYTRGLIESIPRGFKTETTAKPISGTVPSLLDLPPGCRFHPRCPLAMDKCRVKEPELIEIGYERSVRCLLYE
ncbi:MAG: ABC transporter ATP-binding protein, partial [Candidatus Caldarchaeum sp.]|nr:ABC transporter ATP-binding protein [Candidatus Caldarchaeum sp.]MDW8436163.1 ABC transporter ATP-binding protein [Candidatus Caldarchaeum sp.]